MSCSLRKLANFSTHYVNWAVTRIAPNIYIWTPYPFPKFRPVCGKKCGNDSRKLTSSCILRCVCLSTIYRLAPSSKIQNHACQSRFSEKRNTYCYFRIEEKLKYCRQILLPSRLARKKFRIERISLKLV